MPFIGLPRRGIWAPRSAVMACAARAQDSNASTNSSDCQSPVSTENGTPVRTSAFAWSWAPWIPWL